MTRPNFERALAAGMMLSMMSLTGCRNDAAETATPAFETRNVVATTFYPTTWMCEQLLGDLVPVECPLPDGEDPIFWNPSSDAIGQYQSAKLIVVNGAGFEKWIETATLPTSRIVDATAGLSEPFIQFENTVAHQHGPGGEHSHAGTDGHTWLDPRIAKDQAGRIAAAAGQRWPEHADVIAVNLVSLHEQLDALDKRLTEITPRLKGVHILCSHPAYNYIARRYGWQIRNLDLDPEHEVSDDQVAAFTNDQKARKSLMLWEGQPLDSSVAKLKTAGVLSVLFSPAESRPDSGDYLSVMNENLDRLSAVLD